MSNNKYTMSLSLNVLNHLGINLYSNIPAVLSEIVANSWDADAETVKIFFNNGEIIIVDDGCGMDEDDINQKFLTVGYPKRESGNVISPKFERRYMGRKGIGKLSMFSVAKEIEVISRKDGILNAFRMNVDNIVTVIKEKEKDGDYHPEVLTVENSALKHDGTKIILKKLKRNITSLTPEYIRKRIARRFSIIGSKNHFEVFVNDKKVSIADRDYFHKLNYIWYYGEESSEYANYANKAVHKEERNNILQYNGVPYIISGWIGTVESSGDLKDGEDNINKIVILVRGKLGQEDILDEYTEGGLYSKYLIGEIHADFFDDDMLDDMATSSRQEYRRDDDRFVALKNFIYSELKYIQNKWTDLRNASGVEHATAILPVIDNWYKTLQGDDKKYAKKMLGKVNQIVSDSEKKSEILKYSILAFEKLRYINKLSAIDSINPENIEIVGTVFNGLDELEATLYYQIIKERTEVIKHFRDLVTDDAKEKVIQSYLFNHLWLLDPSWERVDGTEYMETTVLHAMNSVDKKLTPEEKAGRLDLGYRMTAGKHLIIELKRSERIVNLGELTNQVMKYSDAMEKVLQDAGYGNSFEIICVLGKPVDSKKDADHREKVKNCLKPWHARVVYYSELIENAYRAYQEYLKANEQTQPLIEIMNQLDFDL